MKDIKSCTLKHVNLYLVFMEILRFKPRNKILILQTQVGRRYFNAMHYVVHPNLDRNITLRNVTPSLIFQTLGNGCAQFKSFSLFPSHISHVLNIKNNPPKNSNHTLACVMLPSLWLLSLFTCTVIATCMILGRLECSLILPPFHIKSYVSLNMWN